MAEINPYFHMIQKEYIFPIIENKLEELQAKNPPSSLLNLGIGDVSKPLIPTAMQAFISATLEMGEKPIGYGPSSGYRFLKKAIIDSEYANYEISEEEIFISDGILSDIVNLLQIFSEKNIIAIPTPAYPSYLDATIISGKSGQIDEKGHYQNIIFLPCVEETAFKPLPPKEHCDVIYLCSPNNPTGIALTQKDLENWIAYSLEHQAVILFDAAYSCFISSPDVPSSIYAIKDAKKVAVEMRSFSKSSGFTGLRCAYSIFPKELLGYTENQSIPFNQFWKIRQNSHYNGTSFPAQKAAAAALLPHGRKEANEQIEEYAKSARYLLENLLSLGFKAVGGIDSPYVWWKTPSPFSSWEFFDHLLERCNMITIPGIGFGKEGEGFVRLSGFIKWDNAQEAISRIRSQIYPIHKKQTQSSG